MIRVTHIAVAVLMAVGLAHPSRGQASPPSVAQAGPMVPPNPGATDSQQPTPPARASEEAVAQGSQPPLSKECQTPGVRISGEVPLPHVTQALRLRKMIKIMTFGAFSKSGKNSADAGYQQIIESVLEKTIPGIDVQMINRGVSGELARDAAMRIKTEVALAKPDLVLWQLGTHDALMHVSVDEFKTTVREAVDWLRQHEIDVVMVGLHYLRNFVRDQHYQSVRQALRTTAEEKKVLWIGRYEAMQVIEQARRTSGGASPNEFMMTEAGYSCLSEYVARALTSGTFARPAKR